MVDTQGQVNLRAETIDSVVKGFALQEYKFKQVCAVSSSNSWKESYYQEGATELSGGTGASFRGIPRGAEFPFAEPNWTKASSYLEKYGAEGKVYYEDILTDTLDVVSRELLRIARGVAKSVDDQIWSALTTASGNQTFTISTGKEWNNTASGSNIIDNLMRAKEMIQDYNYDPQNAYLLVNQKDHRSIIAWLASKGTQFPTLANEVANNGRAGNLGGLKLVVSPSVAVSGALIIVGQEAATWKSAIPLTTVTIDNPGIDRRIRCWEIGVTQVPNPKAIVWIKNTNNGLDYS